MADVGTLIEKLTEAARKLAAIQADVDADERDCRDADTVLEDAHEAWRKKPTEKNAKALADAQSELNRAHADLVKDMFARDKALAAFFEAQARFVEGLLGR